MENNKYENIQAIKLLECLNQTAFLPDIQREYCWTPEQIEFLFDSIVDEFPIGTFIIWKTNRQALRKQKPNLYKFFTDYDGKPNQSAPEVFTKEADYYIILDGQQRITSLNIALFGSYKCYKGGKGRSKKNEASYEEKELYYNLNYEKHDEDDEEKPEKRFCFLRKDELNNGEYYKVKNILDFDNVQNLKEEIKKITINEQVVKDLSMLYEKLFAKDEDALIHYCCISKNEYDEALNVFVRVNSTGTKLSKTDLIFSTIISGWKEVARKEIDQFIVLLNQEKKFNFTRDYLMRLFLVLVDANISLKIQSLTKQTIKDIRENWEKIKKAALQMVEVLKNIGMNGENLTSNNATMPIVYYIYKGGVIGKDDYHNVQQYLAVVLAQRLFGVASNNALSATRNSLNNIDYNQKKFSLNLFKDIILTGGKRFSVTESDIDYWLDKYKKGTNAYIILTLLYPNLSISNFKFHQDHCHPYSGFETKKLKDMGLSEDKILDWQNKKDLIPNLQLLEGLENESKNAESLQEWIDEGNSLKYYPEDGTFDFKDFEEFFVERKNQIKNKLMELFKLNTNSTKIN